MPATTSRSTRIRIANVIVENVDAFKTATANEGTVFRFQPMSLVRAVLPAIVIVEGATQYTNTLGNRSIEKITPFYLDVYFQEWTARTPDDLDDGTIDVIETQLEETFRLRPTLKDSTGGLPYIVQSKFINNQGLQPRRYDGDGQDSTWYVYKRFTLEVINKRNI